VGACLIRHHTGPRRLEVCGALCDGGPGGQRFASLLVDAQRRRDGGSANDHQLDIFLSHAHDDAEVIAGLKALIALYTCLDKVFSGHWARGL
jgi:hypothetical protein